MDMELRYAKSGTFVAETLPRNLYSMQSSWLAAEIRHLIGYHAKVLHLGSRGIFHQDLVNAGHDVTVSEALFSFPEKTFDVVLSCDLLESCEDPVHSLRECVRVLKPGGLFFFQALNQSPLSSLLARSREGKKNFFSPRRLKTLLHRADLEMANVKGMRPVFMQKASLNFLFSRPVSEDCQYCWNSWPLINYCGFAKRIRYQS